MVQLDKMLTQLSGISCREFRENEQRGARIATRARTRTRSNHPRQHAGHHLYVHRQAGHPPAQDRQEGLPPGCRPRRCGRIWRAPVRRKRSCARLRPGGLEEEARPPRRRPGGPRRQPAQRRALDPAPARAGILRGRRARAVHLLLGHPLLGRGRIGSFQLLQLGLRRLQVRRGQALACGPRVGRRDLRPGPVRPRRQPAPRRRRRRRRRLLCPRRARSQLRGIQLRRVHRGQAPACGPCAGRRDLRPGPVRPGR